jgi:CO/xanthine dehydrogenase Mo-binding subunit
VLLGADKYGDISTGYNFAAQVAEVEVDPETGKVQVQRFYSANDLGKAVNPRGAVGQIEGGIAQGLGYALLEEIKYDEGRVVNDNLLDYRMPTFKDVPPIDSILVECHESQGPYGAKGVGESTIIPTAPAIFNAIYDACGVRLTSLPANAEKVLTALQQKHKEEQ